MTPAMAPLRRRRFAAPGFIASLLLAGCASSEPIDFVGESCPPTALRFPPPAPADACYVRLRQDARPLVEHGRDSYIGANRLGEQQFKAPLAESILRVLARDLRLSGLCRTASLRTGGRPWRLDVDVLHATASFTQGLPDLVPVIPAALEAHVELRLVFSDEDGRVYLDRTFEAR
ncbi:MAG TPA: hypothetical protein VEI02_01425, partial [Planctomycetota bacterium]|nr:hypothetical protein [Planctomycetota bacterium]